MLNDKQKKFCEEYVIDRNATGAARRAGYANPNTQGPYLMKREPEVKKYIAELIRQSQLRTTISTDRVLKEWLEMYELAKKRSDLFAAMRALESISRHIGFYDLDNMSKPPININL